SPDWAPVLTTGLADLPDAAAPLAQTDAQIADAILNRFLGSASAAQISEEMRVHVSDTRDRLRSAVDSIFAGINEMLQSADYFSANVGGVPLEFGNAGSRANVVNLTTGLTAQLYRRTNLTMSVVVPTSSDRQFDSELHIGLNHYFGPGGRRSSGMSR
ncbi:MAG: hypothetical protein ACK5DM_04715, partial [Planctomyces sp.]